MIPRRLFPRLRFWRGWGRGLAAEINRRLRPLEEAGEKQVILDIWVLREVLNRLPRMAAERPTRLTKEASDELIAEAKDELAILREKATAPAKGRNRPGRRRSSAPDRLVGSDRRGSLEP